MNKRFSVRLGIVDEAKSLQIEDVNDNLRHSIWNFIIHIIESGQLANWTIYAKFVARYFRKVPVDAISIYPLVCRNWIKDYFYGLPWYGVYDIAEFTIENYDKIIHHTRHSQSRLKAMLNIILEQEMSGYRFVAGILVPISSTVEMESIKYSVALTSQSGLDGAHKHLLDALSLFAKRPDPDYRNSIKESISAVESIAKILGARNSQGLTVALTELAKKTSIHGALKAGFEKLYGYTSDEGGIRHAILDDEGNVGFDEAKYMLVSCSAFVNYLVSKAEATGLLDQNSPSV